MWAHRSGVCTKHIPTQSYPIKNRKLNILRGGNPSALKTSKILWKEHTSPALPPKKEYKQTGSSLNIHRKFQTNSWSFRCFNKNILLSGYIGPIPSGRSYLTPEFTKKKNDSELTQLLFHLRGRSNGILVLILLDLWVLMIMATQPTPQHSPENIGDWEISCCEVYVSLKIGGNFCFFWFRPIF